MLCDKLTIVKLKQFHTQDTEKLNSLGQQALYLQQEIDQYIADAISGLIAPEKLTFAANKIFKEKGNKTRDFSGEIGDVIAQLADINCRLWHEQEKVYDFENVQISEKDNVVKQLAILNLERNKCIDLINHQFRKILLMENKG